MHLNRGRRSRVGPVGRAGLGRGYSLTRDASLHSDIREPQRRHPHRRSHARGLCEKPARALINSVGAVTFTVLSKPKGRRLPSHEQDATTEMAYSVTFVTSQLV